MLLTHKPLSNIVEAHITRETGGSKEQFIREALFGSCFQRLSFLPIHEIGMGPQKGTVMEELTQLKCEVCRVGAPQVTEAEAAEYQKQVPDWVVVERDGVKRLERAYQFKNFVTALTFTNKVGEIAEQEGHHPAILTEWGKAAVAWWTHKIRGLHRNDFIMAAKTDEVYQQLAQK